MKNLNDLIEQYSNNTTINRIDAEAIVGDTFFKENSNMYNVLRECSYNRDFQTCVNGKFQIPRDLGQLLRLGSLKDQVDIKSYIAKIKGLEKQLQESNTAPVAVMQASESSIRELLQLMITPLETSIDISNYTYSDDLRKVVDFRNQVKAIIDSLNLRNTQQEKQIESLETENVDLALRCNSLNNRIENANDNGVDQVFTKNLESERKQLLQQFQDNEKKMTILKQDFDFSRMNMSTKIQQLKDMNRNLLIELDESKKKLLEKTKDVDDLYKEIKISGKVNSKYINFLKELQILLKEEKNAKIQQLIQEIGDSPVADEDKINQVLNSTREKIIQLQNVFDEVNKNGLFDVLKLDDSMAKMENNVQISLIRSDLLRLNEKYKEIADIREIKTLGTHLTFLSNENREKKIILQIIDDYKRLNDNRNDIIELLQKLVNVYEVSFRAARSLFNLVQGFSDQDRLAVLIRLDYLANAFKSNGFDDFRQDNKYRITTVKEIDTSQLFNAPIHEALEKYTTTKIHSETVQNVVENFEEESEFIDNQFDDNAVGFNENSNAGYSIDPIINDSTTDDDEEISTSVKRTHDDDEEISTSMKRQAIDDSI